MNNISRLSIIITKHLSTRTSNYHINTREFIAQTYKVEGEQEYTMNNEHKLDRYLRYLNTKKTNEEVIN